MRKDFIPQALALVLLLAATAFFFLHKENSPTPIDMRSPSIKSDLVLGEYKSTAYHFSLLYPNYLKVSIFDEGGGATTITFQNPEKGEGFQIFIVPYSESQVSEQRFKYDEPSGVRNNLKNIVVDGASGDAFYGTDATLGDTREVWVVHGGFLYEITTHKSLDTWLGGILQTWRFTL